MTRTAVHAMRVSTHSDHCWRGIAQQLAASRWPQRRMQRDTCSRAARPTAQVSVQIVCVQPNATCAWDAAAFLSALAQKLSEPIGKYDSSIA